MGVISDFLVDVQANLGHIGRGTYVCFTTHIRMLLQVLAPAIEQISEEHDFVPQWTIQPRLKYGEVDLRPTGFTWTWKKAEVLDAQLYSVDVPLRVSIMLAPFRGVLLSEEDTERYDRWTYRVPTDNKVTKERNKNETCKG